MTRIPITLNDYESLARVAGATAKELIDLYPAIKEELIPNDSASQVFPIRWKSRIEGGNFEWVISEMGSVTLRVADDARYSRNPPPIYYVSLGKYENEGFLWEDPDGNPVQVSNATGREYILEKVKLYLQSEKNSE